MDEYCSYYSEYLFGDRLMDSFDIEEEARGLKKNQCIGPFICEGCGAYIGAIEKDEKGRCFVNFVTIPDEPEEDKDPDEFKVPLEEYVRTCKVLTRTILNAN